MPNTDLTTKPLAILHVEDDFADAVLVKAAIEKSGHDVAEIVHVDRFGEALRYLRNHPVDLILLDVNLPDSAVLRFDVLALRRCSAAPIIFVSDMPAEAIADTLHENPSLRFLGKSEFTSSNFASMAQEIFGVNDNQATPVEDNHLHRFEGVLNAMQDAVFVMDTDSEVYWANERGEGLMPGNPLASLKDVFVHGRIAPSRVTAVVRGEEDTVFDVTISPLIDRAVQEELYVAVFREKLD